MTNARLLIFALFGLMLSIISVFTVDYGLAPHMRALFEGHEEIWTFITDLGDSKYMGILLVIIWVAGFLLAKRQPTSAFWPALRAKALIVFASVAATGIFVILVKIMVGRARPYMGDIGFSPFTIGADFASWPSGHTTSVFAFAVAAGMAYPFLRWPLLAVAALSGVSRMVLNMHYMGDIIMGATVGTVGAILIYRWLSPKFGIT